MMLNSKTIGQKIAEARKKKNLSQADLAQQVLISPQAVGKWERGESMPDITTLNRLAEILSVDLNYFSDSFQSKEMEPTHVDAFNRSPDDHQPALPKKNFDWNWDMSQGNWADADFSGLKNLKDKFSSSNMKNCKFMHADLSGLILGKNNIERCDFSFSNIRDSKIQYSNLLNNQFLQTSFIDAEFRKCNISKCDFSSTNFSGASFFEVNFENNVAKEALWKFTSFKNTNISDIVFEGNIEDCHFEHCEFHNVKFQDAVLTNTFFKYNTRFKKVQFINCKVDTLTYAFLKNNQANLTNIEIL